MSDPGSTYRTRDEINSMRQERDPIERVKKLLLKNGWLGSPVACLVCCTGAMSFFLALGRRQDSSLMQQPVCLTFGASPGSINPPCIHIHLNPVPPPLRL